MTTPHPLVQEVDALFRAGQLPPWDALLDRLLLHFDCATGTIHVLEAGDGLMHLRAQRGLPPAVLGKVGTIPIGKGMAGIAAERRQPVQVCNLQTDQSGVARPDAKLTKMEGSIAVPMLLGSRLCGVLGVAKPTAYEFTPPEVQLLLAVGAGIARHL